MNFDSHFGHPDAAKYSPHKFSAEAGQSQLCGIQGGVNVARQKVSGELFIKLDLNISVVKQPSNSKTTPIGA
jgi:hypothetical protein